MTILAGTNEGIFRVSPQRTDRTLECRGVRDLQCLNDEIFAATASGIWRSRDDGASWQASGLDGLEVWQVRADGDGTLYAGTQPAGLYRSADSGNSWDAVDTFRDYPGLADWRIPIEPPVPARARTVVIDRNDARRLRVGVEVGGILMTDDGGRSWRHVLPGDNPDLHVIVQHPARPDEFYASTGYGRPDGIAEMIEGNAGMFRSVDGGNSWTYVWRGVTPRYARPLCIDPRPPWPLTVAAAPTAFSNIKDDGGAQAVLFRSDDSGDSWRPLGDPAHSLSKANFHGLAPTATAPGDVMVGTDGGELWHVDSSCHWSLLGSGMPAVLSALDTDL